MNSLALIPGMEGPSEMLLIFLAILLLFGGKKLPELARSLGKSISEFKRGQKETPEDVKEAEKTKLPAPKDDQKPDSSETAEGEETKGTEK